MNAVIKVGGKQYYVTEGSEIFVEKLNAEAGDTVKFDQVLMLDSKIGSPYLTNVTVEGKVIKNGKLGRWPWFFAVVVFVWCWLVDVYAFAGCTGIR